MRRATGTGNNHLIARICGPMREFIQALGRAMGGNDQRFIIDLQGLQHMGGMAHGGPVGLASHDNGNRFF